MAGKPRIAHRITLFLALVGITLLALAPPSPAVADRARVGEAPAAVGPRINVSANNGVLGENGWTAGTTVTLTINGVPSGSQPVVPGGSPANSDFWFSGYPPIQPGDIVVVRDDVAAPNTTTRTHVARSISVGTPDTALDTVTGLGPPSQQIRVQVWSNTFSAVVATRLVTADASGQWAANFSVPGPAPEEQDVVDLAGRAVVAATAPDGEGNRTFALFQPFIPVNPRFAVVGNGVYASGWPAGAELTVTVAGTPGFSATANADGGGELRLAFDPFQVQVGDLVTVTNGVTVKTTTVTALTVTDVDVAADTVSGTAAAGSTVSVQIHVQDGGRSRNVVADGLGAWTADFSVAAGGQPQDQPYDIVTRQSFNVPATQGSAQQNDADGDGTWSLWDAGRQQFAVGDGGVWGNGWIPGADITVTAGPSITVTAAAPYGDFMAPVDPSVFHIAAGDVVTVTDGVTTKTHTVTSLANSGADAATDTVSGTAAPGSTVYVMTGILAGQWVDWRGRSVIADAGGIWTADFSVSVGGRPEDQPKDLVPGSYGFAAQTDDDGDDTLRNWTIPLPDTSIGGTVYLTSVNPANVLSGVLVEACNAEQFCRTALSNLDGTYRVGGLVAGSYDLRAVTAGNNLPVFLGPVTVATEEHVSGVDIIVSAPPASPPAGAVEPSNDGGGTIVVHWRDTLTLTANGCANGSATFTLTVLEDGHVVSGPMVETPLGSGIYKAVIDALYPHHGPAEMEYDFTCPGGGTEATAFFIYIDPSGKVLDTTGAPIAGATVTLFSSQSPGGPFTQVPDGSNQMSPSNRTNPDTTDADGRFGWDVTAAYYKVRAEKAGCHAPGEPDQPFVESAMLTIPPPVTDLELVLECSSRFVGLTPHRLVDSRNGTGGFSSPWAQSQSRKVTVTGGTTTVPAGATAVVLNVTAVLGSLASHLTVWPAGSSMPEASNLNFGAGQVVANLVTVKVGAGGQISIYNNSGDVHVIVDVVGYYSTDPAGSRGIGVAPKRLLDSRNGTGGFSTPWGPFTSRNLTVVGGTTTVPAGATAVVLNVTGVLPSIATHLTVWPAGGAMPATSNLNLPAGDIRPNLVIVKVGAGGQISIYNNSGQMHVIVDVVGYYSTDPAGSQFVGVQPKRLLDSRNGTGGYSTPWGPFQARNVTVAGPGTSVPLGATAVIVNVTGVLPSATTHLTVWPAGGGMPDTSNLNLPAGDIRPNLVIAKVGTNGQISIYNNSGQMHVIVDVVGYFTG